MDAIRIRAFPERRDAYGGFLLEGIGGEARHAVYRECAAIFAGRILRGAIKNALMKERRTAGPAGSDIAFHRIHQVGLPWPEKVVRMPDIEFGIGVIVAVSAEE